MSMLAIRDLHVSLGGRSILRNVNVTVDAGELVGLLGPNGAGKTTLLRAAAGLLPISSGSVSLDGRPLGARREGLAYVPQQSSFRWDYPIDVEQAVMTGRVARIGLLRRPGVADWHAVLHAIADVGLADLRDRAVGELSGGQRQRVLIARALASEPFMLLLDEPFTGLDLPTQDQLAELLAELTERGMAVMASTHDLSGAMHRCDRLVLLNGSVIACGPPDQLRTSSPWIEAFQLAPSSPIVRTLAGA